MFAPLPSLSFFNNPNSKLEKFKKEKRKKKKEKKKNMKLKLKLMNAKEQNPETEKNPNNNSSRIWSFRLFPWFQQIPKLTANLYEDNRISN